MGILQDLRTRVQGVNEGLTSGGYVREVVMLHRHDILDLQQYQLLEGKDSSGNDMRPYYSEDLKPKGYFYSVESAGRYAAWKKDVIQYPYQTNRNPDAPNLYINGRFHSEMSVEFGTDAVAVVPGTPYAGQIMSKYGKRKFGLMRSKWNTIFVARGGYEQLMRIIKSNLYV